MLCGTPIGNLGDVSTRLAAALATADVVFAEDTRRARVLLEHLGVSARVESYFAGNEAKRAGQLEALLEGRSNRCPGHRCGDAVDLGSGRERRPHRPAGRGDGFSRTRPERGVGGAGGVGAIRRALSSSRAFSPGREASGPTVWPTLL